MPGVQGCLWQQLWREAPAQPAALQRPLWDALAQGELALDWLDTLQPAAWWDALLAAALSAALARLAMCAGALLPPAAALLHRWDCSRQWLPQPAATLTGPAAAAGSMRCPGPAGGPGSLRVPAAALLGRWAAALLL